MLFILSPILSFWSSALYAHLKLSRSQTHSNAFNRRDLFLISIWFGCHCNFQSIYNSTLWTMWSMISQLMSGFIVGNSFKRLRKSKQNCCATWKLCGVDKWRWVPVEKKSRTLFSIECRSINWLKTWAMWEANTNGCRCRFIYFSIIISTAFFPKAIRFGLFLFSLPLNSIRVNCLF